MVFKNGVEEEKIRGADPQKLQRVVKDLVSIATGATGSSSSASGSSTGWRTGHLPKGYGDVTDQVDVKGLELLNSDDEFGTVRVLFEDSKPSALDAKGKSEDGKKDWVESDTDEQLMLFTPFQAMLKVHTIQVSFHPESCMFVYGISHAYITLQLTSLPSSPSDEDAPMRPKTVHFYTNRPHILGFEEAEDIIATQTVTLSASDFDGTGTANIALRFVKFQNVTSIVMFIENGDGEGDKVRVDRIRIIGETGEKRDQGQLKKISDDE